MDKKLGYVSLFSSAGVGCIGFNMEGFDCVVTAELLPKRLQIQKFNDVCSSSDGYILGDLTDLDVQNKVLRVAKTWAVKNKKEHIDVVIATPPCQGMSIANHKKNNELNRNSLVIESLELILKLSPKYFVLENVRSFLTTMCTDSQGEIKTIKRAIISMLSGSYNIDYNVVNLINYGSNSSRPRTIVIGVRKDIKEVTPFDIFPRNRQAPTLRKLISDLPKLKKMDEVSDNDIYHAYRKFDTRMLNWIKDLKPGESAFGNINLKNKPHRIVDGKMILNAEKNSDKYRRCEWDKYAPCVHTRNDILASQNTVHPEQNRVFSIRELMRFLTIPENFKWDASELSDLNALTSEEKLQFLRKNELNIRKCLGEAVPTAVFQSIAQQILISENRNILKDKSIRDMVKNFNLTDKSNLINFLNKNIESFPVATKIAELANAERDNDAAYYTSQDVAYTLLSDLPDYKNKKELKILEPAVGVGNFLPILFKKYKHIKKVHLDLIDINSQNIEILKYFLKRFTVPSNFEIRISCGDFLTTNLEYNYDLIVSNPPFGSCTKETFDSYKERGLDSKIKSKNLYALFLEKSMNFADTVAFITPKSLLSGTEFMNLRNNIKKRNVLKIVDFGEKAFENVKIETIGIVFSVGKQSEIMIESNVLKNSFWHNKDYIFDNKYPYWIIYRNEYFDQLSSQMVFNCLKTIRDRALTSKNYKSSGRFRVLKARNIENNSIRYFDNDLFINELSLSPIIDSYFNKENILIAPNLSYYPRAATLPKNTVVDGSAAILTVEKGLNFSEYDIEFFGSREFYYFYRIARNYSVRSLNIDSSSIFFWGKLKKKIKYHAFDEPNRSKKLYSIPTTASISA